DHGPGGRRAASPGAGDRSRRPPRRGRRRRWGRALCRRGPRGRRSAGDPGEPHFRTRPERRRPSQAPLHSARGIPAVRLRSDRQRHLPRPRRRRSAPLRRGRSPPGDGGGRPRLQERAHAAAARRGCAGADRGRRPRGAGLPGARPVPLDDRARDAGGAGLAARRPSGGAGGHPVKVSAALPIGVAALFFESARRRREAEMRLVALFEGAGYAEVILPILDYLEPYEALLTAASRGELYRFIDRDGEQLALRADFTPMLARLLAPRLSALDLPLRLFYRGDVIRYEEERAGRQRELYQVGAELLGVADEIAEREVLRLFLKALSRECSSGLQVVLGFAGALDHLLLDAATGDPLSLVAAVARRERGPVRRACPRLLAVVESGLPERPEDLGPAAADLERLLALRDELAVAFPRVRLVIDLAEFARHGRDPRLTAGLGERSYYDGVVFRAFAGASAL